MKTKRFLKRTMLATAMLTGAAGFYSCSQDEGEVPGKDDRTPVVFNADIQTTRTTSGGESWLADDKVGLFMLTTTGSLPGDIVQGADNVEHNVVNITTGALTPADVANTIYYPQSDPVDFVAYYPYRTTPGAEPYIYKVSVAEQTSETVQNAIDVLYAKKTNVSKSHTAVALAFDHVMSKITLNVTLGNGLTSLASSDMTVGFSGMPLTASVALQDGTLTAGDAGNFSALKAATPTGSSDATFSAILVPQAADAYTGRTAVFTVGGTKYTWTIPNTTAFAKGKHYIYPITVLKTGVMVGTPTITVWTANSNGNGSTDTATEIGSGIAKVRIPAGTFMMGSPANEPSRNSTNETQHTVTLTKDFYMSKYPITNAQYAAFLNAKGVKGETLSHPYGSGDMMGGKCTWGDNFDQHLIYEGQANNKWGVKWATDRWIAQSTYEDYPVIWVTWYGAMEYARWVGGSLPTEAQWEYACRGDKGTLPFGIGGGKKLTSDMANFDGRYPYDYDNGGHQTGGGGAYLQKTTAVGSYAGYANSYGLYDMHGNVYEWCNDWYDQKYGLTDEELAGTAADPTGPTSPGSYRVLRGGSWYDGARNCRSAYRSVSLPVNANADFGFRVVFAL